jgi:Flp pilus assembly protein TadB
LNAIKGLSALGNKAQYEYTDEDVQKIEQALKSAVDVTVKALKTGKPVKSTFSL